MPGYVLICLNGVCFTFPLWLHYITGGYLFERVQETRGYNLNEHDASFLKRQILIFSIAHGSIYLFLVSE